MGCAAALTVCPSPFSLVLLWSIFLCRCLASLCDCSSRAVFCSTGLIPRLGRADGGWPSFLRSPLLCLDLMLTVSISLSTSGSNSCFGSGGHGTRSHFSRISRVHLSGYVSWVPFSGSWIPLWRHIAWVGLSGLMSRVGLCGPSGCWSMVISCLSLPCKTHTVTRYHPCLPIFIIQSPQHHSSLIASHSFSLPFHCTIFLMLASVSTYAHSQHNLLSVSVFC